EASLIESVQSSMTELESLFDEDIGKARKMDLSEFSDALKNQAAPVDEN
ncbi:MAG: glutathione-regulated potassium-efflux system protein KefB, partial [Psychrobacter okhotskensis]